MFNPSDVASNGLNTFNFFKNILWSDARPRCLYFDLDGPPCYKGRAAIRQDSSRFVKLSNLSRLNGMRCRIRCWVRRLETRWEVVTGLLLATSHSRHMSNMEWRFLFSVAARMFAAQVGIYDIWHLVSTGSVDGVDTAGNSFACDYYDDSFVSGMIHMNLACLQYLCACLCTCIRNINSADCEPDMLIICYVSAFIRAIDLPICCFSVLKCGVFDMSVHQHVISYQYYFGLAFVFLTIQFTCFLCVCVSSV